MSSVPPDPSNPDLLEALRAYLNTLGLARIPAVPGPQPPLWIAPALGTPAPGEGENPDEIGDPLVLSARLGTGIPPARYENFLRNDSVEIIVRSREAYQAYGWENQLRIAINDKRGWQMDNVLVNESLIFRTLQPIMSDNSGFTFRTEYIFTLWTPDA